MRKKILFLVALFIFMPFAVHAESNSVENINIYMKDIKYGETPVTNIGVTAQHLSYDSIPVTWYESENGTDYIKMNSESTFDYNTYYKVVYGKTFAELSGDMDVGWEANNIYLTISKDSQTIDEKVYSISDVAEYIFEPIWKYKINYLLEGITFEGPNESLEGELFTTRLIPNKNYRLPTNVEAKQERKIIVTADGYSIDYSYDSSTGNISILPENMKQNIEIMAMAIEMGKFNFNNNDLKEFILDNNQDSLKLTIEIDGYESFDKVFINDNELDTNSYVLNNDTGEVEISKSYLEMLSSGVYDLRVESSNSYAETTFTIKNKTIKLIFDANSGAFKDGTTTLEINDIINFNYDNLEKPTRNGYKFIGFYTEKNGGKSYNDLMNSEAGIEEDTILYARWEVEEENPKTFDEIETSIFIGTISLIGLIGATIYLKKRNKVRA